MIPTSFSQLLGNEFIKECLTRLIKKNAIAHSLLFAGPEGIGKSLFAHVTAAQLMSEGVKNGNLHAEKIARGIHPDLHVYRPEGKIGLHSIQSLRKMCDEIYLPPYEAQYKVFIIHDAHRMLSYSANALLKTFEEPPPRTKIILLTHTPASLLPTILSRCSTYFFQAISKELVYNYLKENFSLPEKQLKFWAHLAEGSLGHAIQLAKRGGDTLRPLLLNALATGQIQDYKKLVALSNDLTDEIEKRKKNLEEELKEIHMASSEYLTAIQQEAMQKELEGSLAMQLIQETNVLFYTLLSWYRDLTLLQTGCKRDLLINQDYETALENVLQFGQVLPLNLVQKAIQETQLAIQRATTLNICLENLFLKLIKF